MSIIAQKRVQGPPATLADCLDRREETRFHTVFRVARVTREHDAGLWRVRNISDRGMMLETSLPLEPGEQLCIHLSDALSIRGKVSWCDSNRCGVEFDEPIDCTAVLEALVTEQRAPGYRPLRLPVSTRAIAYCEKGLHTVKVRDLSPYGAGFEHDGCFRPGMQTMLLFENGEEHRGVVRWSEGGRAGIYLTEPFPCDRLESACRL